MKSLHGNILVLSAALAVMGTALGCGQEDQISGSSSVSSSGDGTGGYGGGPRCVSVGNGGGLTFPVCPAQKTSEFMGMLDGMPYDTKDSGHITAMAPAQWPPYQLSMSLSGVGSLDLDWGNPFVRGRWTDLGGGVFVTPEDGKHRTVFSDSQLLFSCDDYSFLYILHVTGGDLTGCSR
jgi:hypothetical protein